MSNSLRVAAKACSPGTVSKWNNVTVIHVSKLGWTALEAKAIAAKMIHFCRLARKIAGGMSGVRIAAKDQVCVKAALDFQKAMRFLWR
jgi:hypothetical protein